MKFSTRGITRTLSLAVISVPLTLFILSGCGGGGGGGGGSTGSAASSYQMGGAMQGITLSLASASGTVSTLAGSSVATGSADGTGAAATFNWATGTTSDGTNLYVVEDCGLASDIRKIVIATGQVTTLAGSAVMGSADGTGTAATFSCAVGITTDGQALYVTDNGNNKIRKIAPSSGTLSAMTSANAVVTSLTGTANTAMAAGAADGTGTAAMFNYPSGITTDGQALYVVDQYNHKVRKIAPSSGTLSAMTSASAVVTTLTGAANTPMTAGAADGTGTAATFNYPSAITTDGNALYVMDTGNFKIRKIAPSSGTLSAMTGANAAVTSLTGAANAAMGSGAADGAGTAATFFYSFAAGTACCGDFSGGLTTDGHALYVTDGGNNKIRMIAPSSGTLSAMTSANAVVTSVTGTANTAMLAGTADGPAATASFSGPFGLTTDGSSLYAVDRANNTIRKIH